MARLIDEESGSIYELKKKEISIGRPSRDLRVALDILINNPLVSRRHAIIHQREDGFEIENLSTNGTLVNGAAVHFYRLKHRDKITIAGSEFVFLEKDDEPVQRSPRAEAVAGNIAEKPVEQYKAPEDGGEKEKEGRLIFAEHNGDELGVYEQIDSAELRTESRLFKEVLNKGMGEAYIDKIQQLFKITNELNATTSEDELYAKSIDLLKSIVPMNRCAILIVNQENNNLEPKVTFESEQKEHKGELFVSKGVVNEVLSKNVAFLASDISANEQLRRRMSVFLKKIKSVMCAPLGQDDRVMGVCYVDSTSLETQYEQIDLMFLGIFCNIFARAITNCRLTKTAERQAVLTRNLERYFSPKLVGEFANGKFDLGGKEVEVSVLFTDVRKFSSLAKSIPPNTLIGMLNEHFSLLVDIIMEFEGTVDKYIGDSVMAFWGAPVAVEHAPMRCVLAAIEIQRQMRSWQGKKKAQEAGDPFSIGIGINTGIAIAGNIGSPKRMDYSIVSDAVNMTERLCSLAQANQILISEGTYEKVKDFVSVKEIPVREVKGGFKLKSYEVIWN